MTDLEIVCLSSSRYCHLLPVFAYFWNNAGGTRCKMKVISDTPLVEPRLPGNFTFTPVESEAVAGAWSTRLIKAIDRGVITRRHALIMLDDYFISGRMDLSAIRRVFDVAISNNHIGRIGLTPLHQHDPRKRVWLSTNEIAMFQIGASATFQLSTQASIWQVGFLRSCLVEGETIWQFELAGTKRLQSRRVNGVDPPLILEVDHPLIEYVNAVGGLTQGTGYIERSRLPDWMLSAVSVRGIEEPHA